MDRLNEMLIAQWELQRKLGHEYVTMTTEQRVDHAKEMILACIAELVEALDEMGWKSWATSRHLNATEAFGELRDAWQFLTNAMFAVSARPPEEMAALHYTALFAKLGINHQRIDEGYDGVATKCPACRRDLVEHAPREVTAQSTNRVDLHCICGAYIGSRAV